MLDANRKIASEAFDDQFGLGEAAIPSGNFLWASLIVLQVGIEAFEITMEIALREARALQRFGIAIFGAAIAADGNARRPLGEARLGLMKGEGVDAVVFGLLGRGGRDLLLRKRDRSFAFDDFPAHSAARGTIRSRHLVSICALRARRKETGLWKVVQAVDKR